MKQLTMQNGDVVDGTICHACQTPGADVRADDGECYHRECVPEDL